MKSSAHTTERLIALALAGMLAFNYPLLFLFGGSALVFGIPVLYLYLFTAWGLFILLAALIMERRSGGGNADSSSPGKPEP